jgi:hypothetical protein
VSNYCFYYRPLQQFDRNSTEPSDAPTPDPTIIDDDETGFLDYLTRRVFPALFLTISSHLYDFSFYFSIIVVLLLLLSFAYQFMTDVSTFVQFKKEGDTEAANKHFFHSFVGTMVYGHGKYVTV